MSEYGQVDWDPAAARAAAEETLGDQDCTGAVVGAREAFANQGWRLDQLKLWWRPGWSPDSHIRALVVAEWVGGGRPRGPQIKVIVYDSDGGLVNIDDISPYDAWERKPIPPKLAYDATIHLVGSGPSTAPGRIEMMADNDEEEDEEEDDASYYR